MHTLLTLLVAGALAVSAAPGMNDQMAEERYRAKYGRYTPAEEARRHAAEIAKRNTMTGCGHEDCCVRARGEATVYKQAVASGIDALLAERFKAKWGCSLVHEATHAFAAGTPAGRTAQNTRIQNEPAARLQIKTGRFPEMGAVQGLIPRPHVQAAGPLDLNMAR